jgi:hypothetical protein
MRALGASRTSLVPGGVLAGPWVRDDLWRRARAVPSLDLRFADNKSLTDAVTGASLVTFTRASSGTYTDSAGVLQTAATDVPRFDHDPTTGESLGLLVEEQRTNLLLQSEDFSTTWTTRDATVSTNQVTAPDGATTADKIIETATNGEHHTKQDTASQVAGTYSASIFAKAGERDVIQFVGTGPLGVFRANFDLTNGVIGSADSALNARITSFPNGWYRCNITATSTTTGALRAQWNIVTSPTAARVESYLGDVTKGLYLWGAQLEAGASPTSYIPTTTATVTRSADVASITGSAFSGWYRQDEGTVFAEFVPRTFAQACGLLSLDDGTTSERLQTRLSTNGNGAFVVADGGSVQANFSTVASTSLNTKGRLATSFAVNSFKASLNGGSVASDTSGTLPTVAQAVIGNAVGAFIFNGPISRIAFWPREFPESTLQTITQ